MDDKNIACFNYIPKIHKRRLEGKTFKINSSYFKKEKIQNLEVRPKDDCIFSRYPWDII